MKKINILYLITSFDIGGAELVIARTVRRLNRNKYNITIAALQKGSGQLIPELPITGVQIVNLGMKFKYDITGLYKLYFLLKRERIDLIYAYLFHPIILSRIVGRIAKIPIILSSERYLKDKSESSLKSKFSKLTCRYSDKITTASQAIYESCQAIGIPKEKLLTIHNCVDIERFICAPFTKKSDNSYTVGYIGNPYSAIKGHRYLIEAAHILRNFNLHYRFIGDGIERKNLEQQVLEKRLNDRIEFLGHRSDIPEQLAMLDIYVQPSEHEGMPNAIMEAMASGLPVIATNVGGTPEVVIDNQTGFLIPPKNPGAIAEKIMYIIEHPNLARQIGQNARAYIKEKFSVESMVEKTDELFQTIIAEKLGLIYDETLQQWRRLMPTKQA